MDRIIYIFILFFLLFAPLTNLSAQNTTIETKDISFKWEDVPQWAKDVRRFEIIAFGTFPFSMFFSTFLYDLARWNNANGMDFSEEGRRYAPWPLRSAGGIEMTSEDYRNVLLIAAGISVTLAITDIIITVVKRDKEKRKTENIPSGYYEIETSPFEEPEPEN